jgi:hypothetical protein
VTPGAGQLWCDIDGYARVLAIVDVPGEGAYAVLQRTRASGGRRRRPFLFPVASLLAGDDGWHCVEAASPAP